MLASVSGRRGREGYFARALPRGRCHGSRVCAVLCYAVPAPWGGPCLSALSSPLSLGAPEGGVTKAAITDLLVTYEGKFQALESSEKWSRGWNTFKVRIGYGVKALCQPSLILTLAKEYT